MGFIKKPKSQVVGTEETKSEKKEEGVYSFVVYAKTEDEEKAEKVTGLWKHAGKKDNTYFKGKNKEMKVQLFAFPQFSKKTKEFQGYKLQRRDIEEEGFNPIDCGLLTSRKKKSDGEEFFACTDEDGTDWLMFAAKEWKD